MTTKSTIPELLPLLSAYYAKPQNCNGGALHIVLEDGNVHDKHLTYCIGHAKQIGDIDGENIGMKLLAMSKTQRKKLCQRSDYK